MHSKLIPRDAAEIGADRKRCRSTGTLKRRNTPTRSPANPLRALLDRAMRDPARQATHVREAAQWTRELADEADGYAASDEQQPDARAKLQRILAAREFDTEYKQSGWDRLQQRFWAWVGRMLDRLAGRMSRYPIAARGLFWLLLMSAVACVALLVFRAWQRRARVEELKAPVAPKATQTWQEWMRAAKLAADGGNFRDAVHSLYWAGVVGLLSKTPASYRVSALANSARAHPALGVWPRARSRQATRRITSAHLAFGPDLVRRFASHAARLYRIPRAGGGAGMPTAMNPADQAG